MRKGQLLIVFAVPVLLWTVASIGPRAPTEMPAMERGTHPAPHRSAEPDRPGTRSAAAMFARATPGQLRAERAARASRTEIRPVAPERGEELTPPEPLHEAAPAVADGAPDVASDQERMQKRLHERWAAESDDAEWSSRVGVLVGQAIADGQIKGSLRAAQCRTTLCRLQFAFDSPQEASKLAELVEDPSVPKQFFWSQQDDRVVLEVYMVRDATRQL